MVSINTPNSNPGQAVFIFSLTCDFCGEVRSRKGALCEEVRGVHRFVCALCCKRAGASCYADIFGRQDYSLVAWLFGGSAA